MECNVNIGVGGAELSGRVCVVDVESAVADDVVVYLPVGDGPTIRRSLLQKIAAIATLRFRITEDGLADINLSSLVEPTPERDLVLLAEGALAWLGERGTLVSHNGVSHDLPLIRRRAMRTWMFDHTPSVFAWADPSPRRHYDTMLSLGQGSLLDLCAGLGIPALVPRRGKSSVADGRIRKCEVDVVATGVAFLHAHAAEIGSATWLAAAWRDLACHLVARPSRDHLMSLVRRGIELGDDLAQAGNRPSR